MGLNTSSLYTSISLFRLQASSNKSKERACSRKCKKATFNQKNTDLVIYITSNEQIRHYDHPTHTIPPYSCAYSNRKKIGTPPAMQQTL
jgi:hypothetical protein